MKSTVPKLLAALTVLIALPLAAADDQAALEDLLNTFLAGASANDPAAHERFWADDLVYTSSSGARRGKPEILDGVREAAAIGADEPAMRYGAEDVDIRVYGDMAVVAFRLTGQVSGQQRIAEFFNTGTFRRQGGEWRAVAWQATRIPAPEPPDEWVDLSHELSPDAVFWPTAAPFSMTTDFEGMTDKGYFYSAYSFCTAEHGGTHIDAPVHFAEGAHHVNEIPVEQLIGPAVVIDVSAAVQRDRDHRVSVTDVEAWEARHGAVPAGSIVLFRTGFGKYWPDAAKYLGTARRGAEAVAELSFPGLHPEAAAWLMQNRDVKAVGIDTASIDYGKSTHFETHVALMTHNVPAFENVANLDRLPPTGAYVVALPTKIRGGSGGPLRIVARLDGSAPAPQADLEALRRQVADTERAFAQTMADRDHAAFTAFLSDEAVFFGAEMPLIGKDAVAAGWAGFFEAPEPPFSWAPESVVVLASGTLAHSSGPVMTPDGRRVATFNSIWRRTPSGAWKVVFDKGSRDCPPPDGAAASQDAGP